MVEKAAKQVMSKSLGVYAVYDRVAKEFAYPACVANDESAKRSMRLEMLKENCPFRHCPEDFDLYCLGHYDCSTGVLDPFDKPFLLARLSQIAPQTQSAPVK